MCVLGDPRPQSVYTGCVSDDVSVKQKVWTDMRTTVRADLSVFVYVYIYGCYFKMSGFMNESDICVCVRLKWVSYRVLSASSPLSYHPQLSYNFFIIALKSSAQTKLNSIQQRLTIYIWAVHRLFI